MKFDTIVRRLHEAVDTAAGELDQKKLAELETDIYSESQAVDRDKFLIVSEGKVHEHYIQVSLMRRINGNPTPVGLCFLDVRGVKRPAYLMRSTTLGGGLEILSETPDNPEKTVRDALFRAQSQWGSRPLPA